MRIEAKGQHLVLSGAFDQSGNKQILADRLTAAGATIAGSMSSKTTAVVIGRSQWPTNAENHARQRGLPVLTEAQAIEMLEQGFVELAEDAAPDAPLDALIGEARSLLDGEPSGATWDALVALLDRCAPEHAPALVGYLDGQLDRWRVDPLARYADMDTWDDYDTRTWAEAAPYGVVRVAPRPWLTQALDDDLPKFSLARAVMFTRTGMTNKEVSRVLAREGLGQVRALDLGEHQAKRSGAVYSALAASPMAHTLEDLRVTLFKRTHARAMSKPSPLRLRRLRFYLDNGLYEDDALDTLWDSEWVEQLEEITFERHYSFDPEVPLPDAFGRAPHVPRVVLEPHNWFGDLAAILHAPIRTDTIALRGRIGAVRLPKLDAMLSAPIPHARHLDLSGLREPDYGLHVHDAQDMTVDDVLFDRVHDAALFERLESVTLGHWHTDARAEAFTSRGIAVADAREGS